MDALGDAPPSAGLKLPALRSVLWFGARFACALAVLLAPWPRLGQAYSASATELGNALLSWVESSRAQLAFAQSDSTAFSTVLHAQLLRTGRELQIPIELRTLAFIPTAALFALVFADAWRRPLRRTALLLVLSALVLETFLLVSLIVPICLFFADPQPMQLFQMDPTLHMILTIFYRSVVSPPGMIYAIPFAVWLLMSGLLSRTLDARASTDR